MSHYTFEEQLSFIRSDLLELEDYIEDYRKRIFEIDKSPNKENLVYDRNEYIEFFDIYCEWHRKLVKTESELNGRSPSENYCYRL